MTLFENISYAVMDCLLSACGVAVQAGIGVAKKVNMLAHCIVRGMSQGVLPLIAYYHGAGDKKRMKQTFCVSSSVSVVLAAACTLCAYLFGRQLIGIFLTDGSPSAGFGLTGLRILCLGCPFSAFAYSVISLFQAVREPRKSFVLAIMRKGILDIPLFILLGNLLGMAGILWSTVTADVLCCGSAWMLMRRFWYGSARPIVQN